MSFRAWLRSFLIRMMYLTIVCVLLFGALVDGSGTTYKLKKFSTVSSKSSASGERHLVPHEHMVYCRDALNICLDDSEAHEDPTAVLPCCEHYSLCMYDAIWS